jgi:FAD/FMN-containing dehydrogenase
MLWYDSRDWTKPASILKSTQAGAPIPLPPAYVAELRQGITGQVIMPGDPDYDSARHVANPAFNNFPSAIIMCKTNDDVALCLKVARESKFPAVARSGGHNTAGFSSLTDGIIINVNQMNSVEIAEDKGSVWAGVGINFGALNTALEMHNLHMPGGACPDVCVGGYMQGGGYGFTARIFGLNCDQALEAEIMLTDGTLLRVSPDNHPDLFRALLGGTGSNYGVLLKVKFKLQPSAQFAGFSIRWNLSSDEDQRHAADALSWLQTDFIKADFNKKLGFQMIWVFEGAEGQPRKPYLLMRGMYQGSADEMYDVLRPVLERDGATLEYQFSQMPYDALNKILLTTPYEVPQFPRGLTSPPPESKLSRIIERILRPEDWLELIQLFLQAPNEFTIVAMEIYGGAIGEVPPEKTVFVHRYGYCDMFCDVFWLTPAEQPAAEAFLAKWRDTVAQYWDGGVYQNYPMLGDQDFAAQFWGDETYTFLQGVKAKYDPENVLRFPQGVVGKLG